MTSHTKCHWGSFPNLLKKFQFSLEQFLVAAQVKPALSLATHTHTHTQNGTTFREQELVQTGEVHVIESMRLNLQLGSSYLWRSRIFSS